MKIQVTLNLGKKSNAELLVDADNYIACITGDPLFPAGEFTPLLTPLKTAVTNLRNALSAPLSDSKTDQVRITRDVVERMVMKLASRVVDLANDPTQLDASRINIVHSAGMSVKMRVNPKRRVFTVKQGRLSGSVLLYAGGGVNAHEWQYTTDLELFTNRIAAPTTTTSKLEITNLTKGVEYAFFHKPIINTELTEWEGPVFLLVV